MKMTSTVVPNPQSVGRIKFKFVLAVQNKKLDKALNLAATRMNQFPALIIAIDNNNTMLCDALLKMGWDPNETRLRDGATPLHVAVTMRNTTVITKLIECGAIVTKKDLCGNMAIARSIKMRMDPAGKSLFKMMAGHMKVKDFRGSNEHGETLLHIAAKNPTFEAYLFQFLVNLGIEVGAQDNYTGRNFLMDMMIFCMDEERIISAWEMAVRAGLKVNQGDKFGTTLLHRLASEQKEKVLEWVSEHEGIPVRVKNQNGQTATWLACKRGNVKVIRLLYKMGETFTGCAYACPGAPGQSPFDIASTNQHAEVAKLVQEQTGEGLKEKEVRPLLKLAKEATREGLARGGVNIWPKVKTLELPRSLKRYLVELE